MSIDLHQLERDAMRRITATINRSAGQHARAVKAKHAACLNALLSHDSPFAVRVLTHRSPA